MNNILAHYIKVAQSFENDLEQLLERALTLQEYNAIRNFGGGMMLESFDRTISSAKTKEQAEAVLTDLMTMKRLDDYIIHYNQYLIKKGFSLNPELDSLILQKGNCLDLMLLMDEIEENKISKPNFPLKVAAFIDTLNKR